MAAETLFNKTEACCSLFKNIISYQVQNNIINSQTVYFILIFDCIFYREHSITHAKASVMLYDNERKQWQHSGGAPGLSRVNIYHHPVNNTFRIVGRKLDDHAVSINSALGSEIHILGSSQCELQN